MNARQANAGRAADDNHRFIANEQRPPTLSAFGGKADIGRPLRNVGFYPKRTLAFESIMRDAEPSTDREAQPTNAIRERFKGHAAIILEFRPRQDKADGL
jgi:hypothetical protein